MNLLETQSLIISIVTNCFIFLINKLYVDSIMFYWSEDHSSDWNLIDGIAIYTRQLSPVVSII